MTPTGDEPARARTVVPIASELVGARRRLAGLSAATALVGALILAGPVPPASAHLCPVTSLVPPGETAAVPVAITVEQRPVADAEITFPSGLRLDRFRTRPGWTATRRGTTVRVRGPELAPYSCIYFSADVTPERRGVFAITLVLRDRTGAVVARSTPDLPDPAHPYGAQRVYAGVDPPSPPGSGPDPLVIAGIALIAIALLAAGGRAGVSLRNRRRDARDAELEARLDRFVSSPEDGAPIAPPPPGDREPPLR